MALADQVQAQCLDEGALAHAGHAADAQSESAAGVRQKPGQQRIGLLAVVGAGGLQQRDGLGHGTALDGGTARDDAGLDLLRRHATAFLICSSTSFALAGIGVSGP